MRLIAISLTPVRATDKDLLMPIEDVFSISVVAVVTGRIEKGVVKVGDNRNRWYQTYTNNSYWC